MSNRKHKVISGDGVGGAVFTIELNIKYWIEQYIKEELPESNVPYHHEAEVASGLRDFERWAKEKFLENKPQEK